MTETLQRPSRPVPPRGSDEPAPASVWVGGAVAAVRTALVGLLVVAVPVLVLWAADDRSGAGALEAVRTAGQLWLVAHGADLAVPGGEVGLTPLALLALPLWLLARAGRRLVRRRRAASPGAVLGLAVAVSLPYALLALLVATASASGDVQPGLVTSPTGALLLALGGVVGGGLGHARLWRAAWLALPALARRLAGPVAMASGVLVGAGALLVGVSLALHLPQAADLAAATAPGPVAGAGLLLAGIALVPNAVIWAVAWLAGPGFSVGVGTTVAPFAHELGAVPTFPLLAALPASPAPGWLGVLALAVPVLAGVLVGRTVERAAQDDVDGNVADPSDRLLPLALEAAAVGPLCGLLWLLLSVVSAGAVGGDRLAEVGPAALPVALALSALVGLPAGLTAFAARVRGQRVSSPSNSD